jgi:mycoredoxin
VTDQQPSLPITVLGAATCEDTAIVVDRLRAAGIPHRYVDVDRDPDALARIERLNGGRRVTPTVIAGVDEMILAEPSLEQLGTLVRAAGHGFERPAAVDLHGAITDRAIPLRPVGAAEGRPFSLASLRGRRQVALFLAHGSDCLTCFGYARQLARQGAAMDEADATSVIVVAGSDPGAEQWSDAVALSATLVDDPGAAWKTDIAAHLGVPADAAMLVVLDRFLAPRATSTAPDAGGLIDPTDATDWLRFLALECPECSGEVEWPEEALG